MATRGRKKKEVLENVPSGGWPKINQGTHLTVKAQAKDGQFLPLFRTEPVSYTCPDNFCADPSKVEDSFGLAIGTNGQITLDTRDQYRHLDIQRSNGTIKILFTYPLFWPQRRRISYSKALIYSGFRIRFIPKKPLISNSSSYQII